jgi:hypothetical protein
MNIQELDRLISRLKENPKGNAELIEFYNKKRVELLHKICDELAIVLCLV